MAFIWFEKNFNYRSGKKTLHAMAVQLHTQQPNVFVVSQLQHPANYLLTKTAQ